MLLLILYHDTQSIIWVNSSISKNNRNKNRQILLIIFLMTFVNNQKDENYMHKEVLKINYQNKI
ncbi:hypothetical protein BpHYR1_039894 [Brachionus plicatilis]|uniref:Uncharacterized protein n=1 Tax=Brachionus plicatilis TaxID=10195 RepID=A0A3M7RVQ8_BRAPC|nr:hypothetical protein BpHYR1_039894 [Brachionus plicatilis]